MPVKSLCDEPMNDGADWVQGAGAWSRAEGPALLLVRVADDGPPTPGPADALPSRAAANDDIDAVFIAFLHFVVRDLVDHPVGDDLDDLSV